MTDARDDRIVDRSTNHWAGAGAIALLFGGVGVLASSPGLVLSSVVCAALAGYAGTAEPMRVADDDGEAHLSIRRRLADSAPEPGEEVTVTVELANAGDGLLPDVRVVDGVPTELEVVDGSPRHGAILRPGGRTVFQYTVRAARGDHEWRPATVTVADPSGSIERETAVDSETVLRCALPARSSDGAPLRALATPYAGRLETDAGGPGVEFYATREYRPTDPLSRVDWYRKARTGELGTLEFRRERAATVMLVIDARRAAYRAPEPGAPHAVERSVEAANRLFAALLDAGDRAGVASFAPSTEACWLAPGAGSEHRARGRTLLASHPSLSPIPPERGLYETYRADRREELKDRKIERLHRRLPADAQVFFCSPCCDAYASTVARRLEARGHRVTVVSPDPTTDDAPETELAAMEREDRLRALRRAGVRVIDWGDGERLETALARAKAGWSP